VKLPEVISMGTLPVEVKRPNRHEPFDQSGMFAGPFLGNTPTDSNILAHLSHTVAGKLSSNLIQSEYLTETRLLSLTGYNLAVITSAGQALNLTEVGHLTNAVGPLKMLDLFKMDEVG